MNKKAQEYLESLIKRYPSLLGCMSSIAEAYGVFEDCFATGHKLLIAGNGGSCADSEHIVGELMKGFKLQRKCPDEFADKLRKIDAKRGAELAEKLQGALPTMALVGHQGLNTAFVNDVPNGGLLTFAQQVYGYGKEGDVLLGISTSGNSKNVMNAAVVARAKGLRVVALTGQNGGELATVADVAIKAPSSETYIVQELHLPIYHCLCLMIEERFFGE